MKIKRFIRFFAVIVILSILLSMTSFAAQMRASKYLSVYGATITKTSDGNYSIYFNVTAPSRMEHLGVSRISVQRYTGSYWRTEYNYTYPETAELQGENVGRYSATIVYEPQYSNSNYRAVLTFYAANASGSDTGTYTAD